MFARTMINWPGFGWGNPFSEMERMRRQMDALSEMMLKGGPLRLMGTTGVFPPINLTENNESYFVRAELPGLKSEELDIQVTGKSVTISGERKIPSEGEGVRYHRREREAGRFSRIIGLPGDIDAEKVDAKMVDGVLSVIIPKSEAAKPRQITVN